MHVCHALIQNKIKVAGQLRVEMSFMSGYSCTASVILPRWSALRLQHKCWLFSRSCYGVWFPVECFLYMQVFSPIGVSVKINGYYLKKSRILTT